MNIELKLTWCVVSDIADFRAIREDWERLFRKNPLHSPFLAWGWLDCWLTYIAKSKSICLLIARDAQNEMQIVIPLIFGNAKGEKTELQSTNLASYGPDCSDHLGCLRAPEYEDQLCEHSANVLVDKMGPEQRILLRGLTSDQSFPAGLQHFLKKRRRQARLIDQNVCPRVMLPPTWEDFALTLSRNFRSQIRRQHKKALDNDSFTIKTIHSDAAGEFAACLIRLNRSRMNATGKQSSLEDPQFRAFLTKAIEYMAEENLAWMDVIENEKEIVGAALNLVHGRSAYYYMGGFDEDLTRVGPGNILFVRAIQRAIDQGLSEYDFLRGAEKYKYRWGAVDVPIQQLDIYPAKFWRGRFTQLADTSITGLKNAIGQFRNRL